MVTKRVCILTSVHPAFDTRIFHKQAKTLVRAGYDVTLIAQHHKDEVVDGVKIMALPKPKNRLFRMLGTWRVFKLACSQKANVYHFHDPELLPVGLLLKLLTRGRVIYDVHENVPLQILTKEWIPNYSRRLLSRVYTLVERIGFTFYDSVIVAGDDIAWHLPLSQKLAVIGNYPPLEMAGRLETVKTGKNELPVLIYAGSLTVDRGVKEMLQALNCLEGRARLVLVGTFVDPCLEKETRVAAGDAVQIVGQVPYKKVFSILSNADIGLVCFHPTPNNITASWRNNKFYEYMSVGLPVIASNFPLWKEVVEGNNCGLTVNPLDPSEIARAVEYLIEHPDEARRMGENGRKAVIEKYNWENESGKLLAMYEDLLRERKVRQ